MHLSYRQLRNGILYFVNSKMLKAQHSENYHHGIRSQHFMANRWETVETVADFILWVPKSLQMVTAAMK